MDRRQFLIQTAAGASVSLLAASGAQAAPGTPAAGPSFCFCVVSDPHCSEGAKEGLEKYGNAVDKLVTCVRGMQSLKEEDKPDFILLTGDVHPGALKPRLGEISIPIHAAMGNHEADRETRSVLQSMFPSDFQIDGKPADYYSFLHKGVQFICVCDAGRGGDHVGHFCSEVIEPSGQCEWLEKLLKPPKSNTIIFGHIPPERNGADENMFMSRNDSQWFNALMLRTQPLATFFGHLHRPTAEYAVGRTKMVTVRSCSWNFDKVPIGFLHIRVKDGTVTVNEYITGEYA